MPNLERRLAVRVLHLRRALQALRLARVDEFLHISTLPCPIPCLMPVTHRQKQPPIHPIRLLFENGAENHRHPIRAGLHKDRLFLAVPHDAQLALVLPARVGHGGLLVECGEKGGRHGGGFEMGEFGDERGALLYGLAGGEGEGVSGMRGGYRIES
jgi:hypothetical protein